MMSNTLLLSSLNFEVIVLITAAALMFCAFTNILLEGVFLFTLGLCQTLNHMIEVAGRIRRTNYDTFL